jgi:hypothetical protein
MDITAVRTYSSITIQRGVVDTNVRSYDSITAKRGVTSITADDWAGSD